MSEKETCQQHIFQPFQERKLAIYVPMNAKPTQILFNKTKNLIPTMCQEHLLCFKLQFLYAHN